ncbi:MAG: S8 family serine peptidase [Planctomycetota bacterium]|nr:S8 family serine peptidase [Planctomycetota bacterium]
MSLVLASGLACSLGGAALGQPGLWAAGGDTSLKLRTGEVETSISRISLTGLSREAKAGGGKAVIQLDGPMSRAREEALEAAGVRLGQYLPPYAYVVDLSEADEARLPGLSFVRWQGRYEREWKLDPEIGLRRYVTPERQETLARGRAFVDVHVFEDADIDAAAAAIAGLADARVHAVEEASGVRLIRAEMKFADTVLLADFPEVAFVEDAPENVERSNTNTRWIVQSNVSGLTPLYANGLRGQGQLVGVIDSNLDSNHCSFVDTDPIGPAHRKIEAYNASLGAVTHGTHVSGTVAGDAGVDDNTRGIAYQARIVFNTIPAQTESGITQRLNQHYTQGARIHTNSWGDDATTAYTGQCRGIDAHTYANEDSLVLFAVTNTSSLKTPENAKNCLAVGATGAAGSQESFCSGGAGPTNDGRRKPEIFAPGCSTASSASGSSCGTIALTGTSMACPAVAGVAVLARQYFVDGFYPTGAANPSDGFVPSAALLKGVLLNSAVDMANIAGFPSNQEGWGRVLADNALYFPGDARKLWVHDVRNAQGLSTGAAFEQGINVISSAQPLKITLVWSDPAAAANANPAAINNLNLEVMGPAGTFKGNVFAGGVSAAGGTADASNNVEMVLLAAPTPGAYTVRVSAAAVNVGLQGFALVATGDVTLGPRPLSVVALNSVDSIAPGVPSFFDVRVDVGDDELVPGTASLFYRVDPLAPYTSAPLELVSGEIYRAYLPAFDCSDLPQFYVSAEGVTTGVVLSPVGGQSTPLSLAVGETFVGLSDTGDVTTGWTVGAPGDTATTGVWENALPVGTTYQPGTDRTPGPGGNCWITGQHVPGQAEGSNDVDGGTTTLTSPLFDLSGFTDPELSYWRWFFGSAGDTFTVSLSNDGGGTWTVIESVGASSGGWVEARVRPLLVMPLTSQMQLRFVANDGSTNSFVEAGVDDISVSEFRCVAAPPTCVGDVTSDLVVNFSDITQVLKSWGQAGPLGDANGDDMVNFGDITTVLGSFGADCR